MLESRHGRSVIFLKEGDTKRLRIFFAEGLVRPIPGASFRIIERLMASRAPRPKMEG